ncbi:MAG: hypothetical protein SH850_13095 [Planctomycetaceae bacterium]|nr:hypothetical protein [Planctomycetaceae bacterium]
MSTSTIPASEAERELEIVVDRLMKGVRDPEAARKACERMDRMREELWEQIGTVEVAVELIRDARNP